MEINVYANHDIRSLLFADDLFGFNIDTSVSRLFIQMQRNLDAQQRDMEKMGSDYYNRGPGANFGKGGSYRESRGGKGGKGEGQKGKR